jgi:putative DNA primase/helicase
MNRFNRSERDRYESREQLEQIKKSADYCRLYEEELHCRIKRKSQNGWAETDALCPFHDDRRAGSVSLNLATGRYRCFSCNASYSALDFLMNKSGLSIAEAIARLKEVA